MATTIRGLKASYFRGFTRQQPLDLSSPMTILYGGNAMGKSSVLNAIEWCIFGDTCKGGVTGLRERVDWEPENRASPDECSVELDCQVGEGDVVLHRVPGKRRGASGLSIRLPDQVTLKGDEAELWVRNRFGTFSSFMATVYQHQENIRYLAVAQPKEHRDAITRLLGLSDYNDLADAIRRSRLYKMGDSIMADLDKLQDRVKAKTESLTEHSNQIAQKISVDPDTVFPTTIRRAAEEIMRLTETFSAKRTGDWVLPRIPPESAPIEGFISSVRDTARTCFGALPSTKRSQELGVEASKIRRDLATLNDAVSTKKQIGGQLDQYVAKHGSHQDVAQSLSEIRTAKDDLEGRLKTTNELGAALSSLLKYMESRGNGEGAGECPACGNQTMDQHSYLKGKVNELLSAEGNALRTQIDAALESERQADETLREIERLEKSFETATVQLTTTEQIISQELQLAWRANEDPLQVVGKRLDVVETEARQVEKEVGEAAGHLRQIEEGCDRIADLDTILSNNTLSIRLRRIEETPKFKTLKSLAEEAGQLKLDCDAIVDAIISARDEESREIVEASKSKVSEYFALLSENPAVDALEMTMETRRGAENYGFRDSEGNNVVPILSLGDLNSLALAIFSGLGEINHGGLAFQTIIFDDPSQSMGSHHKRALAQLLNLLAGSRQVIVSTMDREFYDLIMSEVTVRKLSLVFEAWSPETGPRIGR